MATTATTTALADRNEARPERGGEGALLPSASGWHLHGIFWLLLAIGGAIGMVLWGKWGLLVAFDTIRAYCF